ncbi:uncharacterized protein LOC143838818 [Paroedura picta]|uniref:uncharacterized protein LOC143838818 n=1 Tax=Paroedura picta TaxID=143630 RepID=UPI004056CB3C
MDKAPRAPIRRCRGRYEGSCTTADASSSPRRHSCSFRCPCRLCCSRCRSRRFSRRCCRRRLGSRNVRRRRRGRRRCCILASVRAVPSGSITSRAAFVLSLLVLAFSFPLRSRSSLCLRLDLQLRPGPGQRLSIRCCLRVRHAVFPQCKPTTRSSQAGIVRTTTKHFLQQALRSALLLRIQPTRKILQPVSHPVQLVLQVLRLTHRLQRVARQSQVLRPPLIPSGAVVSRQSPALGDVSFQKFLGPRGCPRDCPHHARAVRAGTRAVALGEVPIQALSLLRKSMSLALHFAGERSCEI